MKQTSESQYLIQHPPLVESMSESALSSGKEAKQDVAALEVTLLKKITDVQGSGISAQRARMLEHISTVVGFIRDDLKTEEAAFKESAGEYEVKKKAYDEALIQSAPKLNLITPKELVARVDDACMSNLL